MTPRDPFPIRAGRWGWNRAREATSWLGVTLVSIGNLQLPALGFDKIDHWTPIVQHICQYAGAILGAMSTHHD